MNACLHQDLLERKCDCAMYSGKKPFLNDDLEPKPLLRMIH